MAALSFGSVPAVATLGAGGAALRPRGGRWRLRDWRLCTKLTAVLLVPLLLAGVLGALRVTDLVRKAQDLDALARQVGFAQQLGVVVYDLQGERNRVAALLATGRTADGAALQTQVARVDSAVTLLGMADSGVAAVQTSAGDQRASDRRAALSRLSGLAALRRTVLGQTVLGQNSLGSNAAPGAARNAVTAYSDLIAMLLDLDRRTLDGAPDSLALYAEEAKAFAVAEEQASRQQAVLLTGILSGGLSAEQQVTLRSTEARFDAAVEAVSPAQRQLYFSTRMVADRKRLLDAALERAVRAVPLETVADDWNSAAAGTVERIRQGETTLLEQLRSDTLARRDQAWHEAIWSGIAVAVLLVLAAVLLVVVVRSLLRPLRALRAAVFEVADRRLPEAVENLRTADGAPPQPTVDPVPVHSREEVGQVARAFDTVHVEAVRLAAEQAQLRSSLKDVFLNLSERSRRLVQRQRQLIDELRSAAHDPGLAGSVLQLDRLAARMRRHSENLLVLACGTVCHGVQGPGVEAPGVQGPVAVLDVLSSAIAEIDEYQRVSVCPPPAAMVAGSVVHDLVHLIAELLDNATAVAPQGTMVTLSATLTEDKGLVVEITDTGPGLTPDELQAINARLASAPALESSVSGQMGLFVVRGLARQHGITVRLRQRLGGSGITATAVLPPSLVTVDLRVPVSGVPAPRGSGRSKDGVPDGSSVRSGTEGQLPLQVSVIDEQTAADLFSPTSINPAAIGIATSRDGCLPTAQQEWLELFGHHEPECERLSDQPVDEGQVQVVAATDPLSSSITQSRAPAADKPHEVREEIFEMVSAWFRERQSAAESNPTSTTDPEWRSLFDEGWQAAQALRAPVDHEFTRAGLPKRQPRAHLVSGADGRPVPTPVPAGLARTPDAVRGRLSRYQRGLRIGRHARIAPNDAGSLEHPTWTAGTSQ